MPASLLTWRGGQGSGGAGGRAGGSRRGGVLTLGHLDTGRTGARSVVVAVVPQLFQAGDTVASRSATRWKAPAENEECGVTPRRAGGEISVFPTTSH